MARAESRAAPLAVEVRVAAWVAATGWAEWPAAWAAVEETAARVAWAARAGPWDMLAGVPRAGAQQSLAPTRRPESSA